MDPLATARYGLLAAERRFDASATQIAASAGADDAGDTITPMVDMIEAKTAFSANLAVVRFADDMWRSLLDLQSR